MLLFFDHMPDFHHSDIVLTQFHIGGGGEGADSTRPQIVVFITSVRDAVAPQNFATFPKI